MVVDSGIYIRSVSEADLKDCATLYCLVFNAPPYNEAHTHEDVYTHLRSIYEKGAPHCFCLDRNGQVIGFSFGRRKGNSDTFELMEFAVASDFQGRELGKRLLTFVLDKLTEQGFSEVVLGVFESAEIARRLYQQIGFTETHRVLRMRKRLSE